MLELSISELGLSLRKKQFSSLELTEHFLSRIKKYDSQLNSFITTTETQALDAARSADQRLKKGDSAPLTGIPFAHKDIFCTQGVKTSCGSRMLDNFVAKGMPVSGALSPFFRR